jgi:hypothetical protein
MKTETDEPADLAALQTEVQRRVGRNVINFQKLEALLKSLIAIARTHSRFDRAELEAVLRRNEEKVARKTLGDLSGRYVQTLFDPHEPGAVQESIFGEISIACRIEVDADTLEKRRAALAELVKRRNTLVHDLLSVYDESSPEGCRKLLIELDAQNALLAAEFNTANSLYISMMEMRREAIVSTLEQLQRPQDAERES